MTSKTPHQLTQFVPAQLEQTWPILPRRTREFYQPTHPTAPGTAWSPLGPTSLAYAATLLAKNSHGTRNFKVCNNPALTITWNWPGSWSNKGLARENNYYNALVSECEIFFGKKVCRHLFGIQRSGARPLGCRPVSQGLHSTTLPSLTPSLLDNTISPGWLWLNCCLTATLLSHFGLVPVWAITSRVN